MHSKNKKPIKKLLVLNWKKFHVQLRNFQYYGLIQVSYKKTCTQAIVKPAIQEVELPTDVEMVDIKSQVTNNYLIVRFRNLSTSTLTYQQKIEDFLVEETIENRFR